MQSTQQQQKKNSSISICRIAYQLFLLTFYSLRRYLYVLCVCTDVVAPQYVCTLYNVRAKEERAK